MTSGKVVEGDRCRVVRHDDSPLIYYANHLQVDDDVDADVALAFLESELGHLGHREVLTTPSTPAPFVARLALEGYVGEPTLQGLLTGDLLGPAPVEHDIRRVDSAEDWTHLDALVRADHVETNTRSGNARLTEEVTRQMQAVRRLAAPEVQFFLLWDEGEPVAFFSSWPGTGGLGMVEDLFTLPSHRGRGIARSLIHHCVADARARGADAVLIGSIPSDTPKHMYAAMGFETACLTWEWVREGVKEDAK